MTRATVLLVVLVVAGCGSVVAPESVPPPSSPGLPTTPQASATPAPSATLGVSPATPPLEGQIVFEDAGRDFQDTQIWLENADGSNVRKVVSDDATDNSASLSPDGSRIVFYRGNDASFEAAIANPTLFGQIMIVDVDGSNLHELETGNRTNRCDAGPEGDAWSPDGRRIAYVRFCFGRDGNFVSGGVWTINADGTGARQVTKNVSTPGFEDHRAGWSPDGASLTFERIDTSVSPERAAIFTVRVDGTGLRQVTPWSLDANDPDWSPDGALIAFNASAEPSPTQNIYTVHPDGSDLVKLTTYDEAGQATYHPSWSPDGSQLLFAHSPSTDGWADFFVVDRDGGNLRVIARTTLHENHGHWGREPAP